MGTYIVSTLPVKVTPSLFSLCIIVTTSLPFPCYSVTLLLCSLFTLLPCYSVTLLPCYSVPEFLLCYLVTLLLCSLVTPLPSYLVTLNSYHVTLLPLLTFLPTSYPFRRLLRTLPRARYGVPSDPLSVWMACHAS